MFDRGVVARTLYATDNSIYQVEPQGVATPRDRSEVAALLAANMARHQPMAIQARGAGTGTNGQSLGSGLVVDLKRHLNQIIDIDPAGRRAVVEPGVVAGHLNQALAPHGLFWAPHASTMNRATVGGMISTDAAGKGSLRYGRTSSHVESLDVVLDDGTHWHATALPETEAQARAAHPDRIGRLWRALLGIDLPDASQLGLPELARGFSGYGVDRFRTVRHGIVYVDPVPLLAGAEGTLAVITAATVRLTPKPANTVLIAASYPDLPSALRDALSLRDTQPSAIECFDETTLKQGRSSPAWPALGQVVGDHDGAILLIEFATATSPAQAAADGGGVHVELEAVQRALAQTGRAVSWKLITDPAAQAAAWKVRADAVGLLAKVSASRPGYTARPVAFVEDCAVPVANMPQFIDRFRALLDQLGVPYAMFGHADVGCVHVRPALDLTDETDRRRVIHVTDQVVQLVKEFGGVLWGEHGRGFRSSFADDFLPPETVTVMRHVKAAFDPEDILNPGKLYRPTTSSEGLIEVDQPPLRADRDGTVPVSIRQQFHHAFACNGNGLCHHFDPAEVMCPSHKATGDPALSPRGRADLMRAWLHSRATGNTGDEQALAEALAASFDRCLSCSACTGHCPIQVDIPELKSQFLEQYYRYPDRRRPFEHWMMARFERLAMIMPSVPPPIGHLGARAVGAAMGMVDLPLPVAAGRGHRRSEPDDVQPPDVVVIPEVFSHRLDPVTEAASVDALERVGYRVKRGRFVPTGKYAHVKGRRREFRRAAAAQAKLVDQITQRQATPVVIEPAVRLLYQHEYRQIWPDFPQDAVRSVAQMLEVRMDRLPSLPGAPETPKGQTIRLLSHCTEGATDAAEQQRWATILRQVGYRVATPPVGCCGMAGVFGHEKRNRELSQSIYQLSWSAHIGAAHDAGEWVAAPGFSCRSQVKRFTPPATEVHHPAVYLGRLSRWEQTPGQ